MDYRIILKWYCRTYGVMVWTELQVAQDRTYWWAEYHCLLGYNAMQSIGSQPTFWRNMLPPSSGSNKPRKIPV
jgi:hypothetical protein